MIKAIIVDDEIKGRQFLRQLIDKFTPQVKTTDEAANADEASEAISAAQPLLKRIIRNDKIPLSNERDFFIIPLQTSYWQYDLLLQLVRLI